MMMNSPAKASRIKKSSGVMKTKACTNTLLGTLLISGNLLVAPARAEVLTFDELTGQGTMPSPHQGTIVWEEGVWSFYDQVQPPYTAKSGSTRLFASPRDPTPSWDFTTPVVYLGSWFAGYADATVRMDLYLGGLLKATTGTLSPAETPVFLATGYGGFVDRVVVTTPRPDFWVMDDLTFERASPVAEPPSAWHLAVAFGALILLAGMTNDKESAKPARR
jgi:hypothetical protein